MLNLDLVDALYDGLSKAQQQDLIGQLFKRSKQTMNYFHRTKDISMSKLEILADFFHMSMDSLRIGGSANSTYVPGNHNTVSCNFVNSDEKLKNVSLEKEIDNMAERLKESQERIKDLQGRIEDLQERVKDKESIIQMQTDMIDSLKKD
jgi:hypothetical protein